MLLRLRIFLSAKVSSSFEHRGPSILIGREPSCELPFSGNAAQVVSWNHARIKLTPEGARLNDLGSSNGTFLNDRQISGPGLIRVGDLIRLGTSGPILEVVEINLEEEKPQPPQRPHAAVPQNVSTPGAGPARAATPRPAPAQPHRPTREQLPGKGLTPAVGVPRPAALRSGAGGAEPQVFISYASADRQVARDVCVALESKAVRCWIAPRDIHPGIPYAECIVNAIHQARIMVLIFSAAADESPQVLREVERAVSKGLVIVPVRIEDAVPSRSMEYFLSSPHWLDALTPPLEDHLEYLADSVRAILAQLPGAGA